jgi:DNA modification methylase
MLNQTVNAINLQDVRFQANTIYCGDCKDILRHFPENSVDLIYADPPFFSNRRYEIIWNDGYELRAFEDRWRGGLDNYVAWMVERLGWCHHVLKETGSMYLHCDHHAVHYLKVEMDKIFGERNFINEIIWRRQTAHSDTKQGAKHYGRLHDTILFYTKSKNYSWNQQYTAYEEAYINDFYDGVDKDGRKYTLGDITGPGGAAKGNPHYEYLGVTRYWRYSKETMEKLYKAGRIVQTKPGNVPRYKRYLDEMPGVPLQDVWGDVKPVSTGKESDGYPTQKPELLLERIIKTSSNSNDIILDPFCGCGTTIVTAHKLERRWIGIDVSPTACKLMLKKMKSLSRKEAPIIGLPQTEEELKRIHHFEFQNWVFDRLYGRVNPKKVGDLGIDGWIDLNIPTQVKQYEHVGRVDVDKLETAVERFYGKSNGMRGVLIGFSFTRDAYDEIARAKLKKNMEIRLMTVKEILDMT